MKKIMPILCTLVVFFSCTFNTEKNNNVIKNDNTRNLSDFSLPIDSNRKENVSKNNVNFANIEVSDTIYAQNNVVEAICPLDDKGFIELIKNNLHYPADIQPIDGRILTDLVIEKDGSISDVIIVEGLLPELDEEVKRVLKLIPKFTPGKKNGQSVRSRFRMSVYCVTQ